MSLEIDQLLLSEFQKEKIVHELSLLFGTNPDKILSFFNKGTLINLPSGIWFISGEIRDFLNIIQHEFIKKIRYCGLYLGAIRNNFGLSLEALSFFEDKIQRFVILKGKTLQKFIYGRKVQLRLKTNLIKNEDYNKIIVVTLQRKAVGIGFFTVLEREENNIVLEIESIVDLGLYLRKERQMFQ